MYARPSKVSSAQTSYKGGVSTNTSTTSSNTVNNTLQTQNTK